jgi:DnaJ family protein C protein 28
VTLATVLETIAARRIDAAVAEGSFDGLPGAGLPLQLDDDRDTPEAFRLAFHLLKSAGMTPAWIELDRRIRSTAAGARARLASIPADDPRRLDAERAFRQTMREVNRSIDDLNLQVPSMHWQRRRVCVEDEIAHLVPNALRPGAGVG